MSSSNNSSQESLSVVEATAGVAQATTTAAPAASANDARKQPWRLLPAFDSFKDKVHVNKVRDMRLFGNHVNAHS